MLLFDPPKFVDRVSPVAVSLQLAANEDGTELVLEPQNGCLDDSGQSIDRGAILVLADHACGLLMRHRLNMVAMATLNLRVDWIAPPEPGQAVIARARLAARYGTIALTAVDIAHPGEKGLIATAWSQLILGTAPGGLDSSAPRMAMTELLADNAGTAFESFTQLLGLQRTSAGSCLSITPHLVGNASVSALHGGIIGAALDRASDQALQAAEGDAPWHCLGIWIEYMRPAILGGGDLRLVPMIKRVGRTIASIECIAEDNHSSAHIARAGAKFVRPGSVESPAPIAGANALGEP